MLSVASRASGSGCDGDSSDGMLPAGSITSFFSSPSWRFEAVNGFSGFDSPEFIEPISDSVLVAGNGSGFPNGKFLWLSVSLYSFDGKAKLNSSSAAVLERAFSERWDLSGGCSIAAAGSVSKVCLHLEQRNTGSVSLITSSATL